jgi:Cd2+/Zn2+-exporting ATPase
MSEQEHNHSHDHEHKVEEYTRSICKTCELSGTCPTCTLSESSHDHDHDHDHDDKGWAVLSLSGLAIVLGIVLNYFNLYPPIDKALLVAAMIAMGGPLAENGVRSLLQGKIGINLLVTIAAIGATVIGQFEEGALVVFLFSVSLKLEIIATDRARNAIEGLMDLRPEIALLKRDGEEVEVPVEEVLPGDVFIVRPGDRIPLDGKVLEGSTSVDQSTITGESIPVPKIYADEVYAGTINLDGVVEVETLRASEETMLSNILRMVHEAEDRRSPTETIVNRFARYYTPAIIILATLVAAFPPIFLGYPWIPSIYRSLVLLVIGCPCALTIATPVTMVSAITSASRNGVLVKGSNYIEEINKANVFTFDKTGTLTLGELVVTDVNPVMISEDELIKIAAALEANSKHPIAEAIIKYAKEKEIEVPKVSEFHSETGRGIIAWIEGIEYLIGNAKLLEDSGVQFSEEIRSEFQKEGKTSIMVASQNRVLGYISLMDTYREEAKIAVNELRKRGMKVEMLTGDNLETAKAIADKLGFNGVHAELLPDDKVRAVEELKKYGTVVMVGDGVNDAPALASAHVGVAMGGLGSDIALETADIVLLEDNLSRINYLLKLADTTVSRMKENIAVALLVKLGIVILGALGMITLWMAVILGDVGLTLLVILNSIRISNIKP